MADNSLVGDQPRASSKQVAEASRDPSLTYRAKPIKSFTTRRTARKPSRS